MATPFAESSAGYQSSHASSSRATTSSVGAGMHSITLKRSRAGSVTTNAQAAHDDHADSRVGASDDGLHAAHRLHSGPSREICRGPGTPDFTLDQYSTVRGHRPKSTNRSTGSSLRNVMTPGGSSSTGKEAKDNDSTLRAPSRPRLTTQMRSLFNSFTGWEALAAQTSDSVQVVSPKARLMSDASDLQVGGSQSANRIQGLSVTAEQLLAQPNTSRSTRQSPKRPQALLMPAARQANFDDFNGFNEDSPPLTPSASEGRDWDKEYYTSYDILSPQASTCASSGQTSPVQSIQLPHLFSPPTRSSTTCSTSSASNKGSFFGQGLLPSHMPSPPASPAPRDGHSSGTRIFSQQTGDGAAFTTNALLLSMSNAVSTSLSRLQAFFFAAKMPPLRPHLPALFFLMMTFVGSTLCIVLALSTLPLTLPSHITDLTLTEIRDMSLSLRAYSRSSNRAFAHTLAVLGAFFTWKQSFTIPGSIIMNVVFGAMYGTVQGTLFTSVLTAVGGMLCYLLMAPLGPLVSAMPGLNKGLQKMRKALQGTVGPEFDEAHSGNPHGIRATATPTATTHRQRFPNGLRATPIRRSSKDQKTYLRRQTASAGAKAKRGNGNIWSYLLVLRLLPVVPYGLMNIACSVLRVPLLPYTVTLALGSIPWNVCTVQIGDLLVEVVSALPTTVSPSDVAAQVGGGGFSNAPRPGSDAASALGSAQPIGDLTAQSGLRAITEKVWNREMMLKLVLMSAVSLAPVLIQRFLRKSEADSAGSEEEDETYEAEGPIFSDSHLDSTSLAENGSHGSTESDLDDDESRHSSTTIETERESVRLLDPRSWRASWHSTKSEAPYERISLSPSFLRSGHRLSNSSAGGILGSDEQRKPSLKRAVAHAVV